MATKTLSKLGFLTLMVVLAGALVVGLSLPVAAEEEGEPIRIGAINPLEGECAFWGIPIIRGGQIWADEHNAAGGILCGDGKRHKIIYDAYTNVCYIAAEELKAAKKAILEDKKGYIFQTFTPACRKAIMPLLNEYKVLSMTYGAGFLTKDCPYLMGCMTGSPHAYAVSLIGLLKDHPEIKKVAILVPDNSFGIAAQGYYAAVCAANKDKIQVVYNKTYDFKTTDYYPILSTALKEKPDALLFGPLSGAHQGLVLETCQKLGFNGPIANEDWDPDHILKRGVPPAFIENKLYASYGADGRVPGYNERISNVYNTYISRWSEEEWIGLAGYTYSGLCTLEVGLKAAPSIDAETVTKTLYAMPIVEHPIFGKSPWGGLEIFGVNHHLLTPCPVYVPGPDGQKIVSSVVEFGTWWEENKEAAIPALKEYGQIYAE